MALVLTRDQRDETDNGDNITIMGEESSRALALTDELGAGTSGAVSGDGQSQTHGWCITSILNFLKLVKFAFFFFSFLDF